MGWEMGKGGLRDEVSGEHIWLLGVHMGSGAMTVTEYSCASPCLKELHLYPH